MPTLRELGQNFGLSDAIEGTAEATGAVLDLAQTISEQADNSPKIKELAAKIPTLLEALNSPLGQVVGSVVPFLPIATTLIQFFIDAHHKEPSATEIIAIALQAAYLESIREILKQEDLNSLDAIASNDLQKKITELGDLEIDDYEARRALVNFSESKLSQAFNEVLLAKLIENGFSESEVSLLAEIVGINTNKYIYQVIPELGDSVKRLLDWYKIGGKKKFEKYVSIETYLEENIKPLPNDKVFKENFSFQDIYVPLEAIPLTLEGMRKIFITM